MKKKNKYKPQKIHINQPDDLFDKHRHKISMSIIRAIEHAIENKLKSVDFAVIVIQDFASITLEIFYDDFLDTLDSNIKIMESFEEYEMCALAASLKKRLKEAPLMKAKKTKTKKQAA